MSCKTVGAPQALRSQFLHKFGNRYRRPRNPEYGAAQIAAPYFEPRSCRVFAVKFVLSVLVANEYLIAVVVVAVVVVTITIIEYYYHYNCYYYYYDDYYD